MIFDGILISRNNSDVPPVTTLKILVELSLFDIIKRIILGFKIKNIQTFKGAKQWVHCQQQRLRKCQFTSAFNWLKTSLKRVITDKAKKTCLNCLFKIIKISCSAS
jgi:hypothetical protein